MSKAPKPKAPADPDSDAAAGPDPAKAKKKKLMIIGGAAAVLLLGGGGAAFMMMSGGDEADAAHAEEAAPEGKDGKADEKAEGEVKPPAFVEAPDMIVNLRSVDGSPRFLKLRIMLVPTDAEAEAHVKERLPLILDSFQPYLRELRPQDLSGSAAVFRLKEELRLRATDVVGPGQVKDILIQDMIQQ